MKRENRKVKKTNLKEITGNRTELKNFLGKVLKCECFVTNSIGFLGEKRLLTEVRIPQTNYYIKHLWVKEYNLPLTKVPHGYRKIELEVTEYTDKISQVIKYGVKIPAKNRRKPAKMIKPKWKDEFIENEKLKNNSEEVNRNIPISEAGTPQDCEECNERLQKDIQFTWCKTGNNYK